MNGNILKTNNLVKTYHGANVLQNVSISLNEGKIYGLIGRNGAGKTTFMRMIAGLSYPTSGSIELFGCSDVKQLENERKKLGCLIENPGLILSMTAEDNLRYHRIVRGIPGKLIEKELLELVGLSDTGKKKAKDFSLGMKQRLGIAIALLGNPELLILDEPINGLDPVGVIEIRNLLEKLCEEKNMTILISSHNLPELYQLATDYIIIDKGSIVESLTLCELDEKCKHYIKIKCDKPELLISTLEMKLGAIHYKVMPDNTINLYDQLENKELVSKIISEAGIILTCFSEEGDTLENYFISLIGGEKHV